MYTLKGASSHFAHFSSLTPWLLVRALTLYHLDPDRERGHSLAHASLRVAVRRPGLQLIRTKSVCPAVLSRAALAPWPRQRL